MQDVVAGFILWNGRILLTQRGRHQDYPLTWESPGGKIEAGEDHHRALIRELGEEVGLLIKEISTCHIFSMVVQVPEKNDKFCVFLYQVVPANPEQVFGKEDQGLGWFTLFEFQALTLAPANEAFRSSGSKGRYWSGGPSAKFLVPNPLFSEPAQRTSFLETTQRIQSMKKPVQGLNAHRLSKNPKERRFAKAWVDSCTTGSTLAHILDPNPGSSGKPPEPSERDQVVAATVIQWLGSPVGQNFLKSLSTKKQLEE